MAFDELELEVDVGVVGCVGVDRRVRAGGLGLNLVGRSAGLGFDVAEAVNRTIRASG